MVQLSKKAVEDFQALVLKKRGIVLSYDEAHAAALYFLEFFQLVYEPLPERNNGEKKEKGVDKVSQPSKKSN